jgi:hypothetical protein
MGNPPHFILAAEDFLHLGQLVEHDFQVLSTVAS